MSNNQASVSSITVELYNELIKSGKVPSKVARAIDRVQSICKDPSVKREIKGLAMDIEGKSQSVKMKLPEGSTIESTSESHVRDAVGKFGIKFELKSNEENSSKKILNKGEYVNEKAIGLFDDIGITQDEIEEYNDNLNKLKLERSMRETERRLQAETVQTEPETVQTEPETVQTEPETVQTEPETKPKTKRNR